MLKILQLVLLTNKIYCRRLQSPVGCWKYTWPLVSCYSWALVTELKRPYHTRLPQEVWWNGFQIRFKSTVACNTNTADARFNNTVAMRDTVDRSTWQVTGTQKHCRVPGGCTSDERHLLFVNSEPREEIVVSIVVVGGGGVFVVAFVIIISSLSYLHYFCILFRLVKSWFATLFMACDIILLVPLIRMFGSGLEHQSLYSRMREYGFIDALVLSFICVVRNVCISYPRNTEHVCCTS